MRPLAKGILLPKTNIDHLSPTNAKVTVEASHEDLIPHIEKTYKQIAEQVNIPGFRRGKVPPRIIDLRIGKEAVLEQASAMSLESFFYEALRDSELDVIGKPEIDLKSVPKDENDKLVAEFDIEFLPKLKLPNLSKLEVESKAVDDERVEEELTTLRTRYGTTSPVDRPVQKGDFLTLDLVARIDGEIVDRAEGVAYEVGEGRLLDGIEEAVETLTTGESAIFDTVLRGGEHAGEAAEVEVTVVEIAERVPAEANDEFAQTISEYDTYEELRESLYKDLGRLEKIEQLGRARTNLLAHLVAETEVPLPERFLKENIVTQKKALIENEGLDADAAGEKARELVEKSFAESIVLRQLTIDENVDVSFEDISDVVEGMSVQYGIPPHQVLSMLQSTGQFEGFTERILHEKVLNTVIARLTVVDQNGEELDLSDVLKASLPDSSADEESENDAQNNEGEENSEKSEGE